VEFGKIGRLRHRTTDRPGGRLARSTLEVVAHTARSRARNWKARRRLLLPEGRHFGLHHEAKEIRDPGTIESSGAIVVGVSTDGEASHQASLRNTAPFFRSDEITRSPKRSVPIKNGASRVSFSSTRAVT
jgi:hypothetical protein